MDAEDEDNYDLTSGQGQMRALREGMHPQKLHEAIQAGKQTVPRVLSGKIPKGMRKKLDWGSSETSSTAASMGSG